MQAEQVRHVKKSNKKWEWKLFDLPLLTLRERALEALSVRVSKLRISTLKLTQLYSYSLLTWFKS